MKYEEIFTKNAERPWDNAFIHHEQTNRDFIKVQYGIHGTSDWFHKHGDNYVKCEYWPEFKLMKCPECDEFTQVYFRKEDVA